MQNPIFSVVTVTLNPAIDRTVSIPNFTAGVVNRGEHVRSHPGGKGVNVAAALVDYGHTVGATGFLGADNAAVFTDFLEEKGIGDHFVRIPGQTRLAIKITDPVLHQATEIDFPGATPAPGHLEALSRQLENLAGLDHSCFVLAGSVPPGVDAGIYREMITKLRAREHKVVLDTSGAPLCEALEALPHVMKPNIHELEALLGRKLEGRDAVIEAARTLTAKGIELVVVSMGAEGAVFVTQEQVVFAGPPSVKVRSTVGAGDAMVAGIVAAQLNEFSLPDCARMATAFALEALARGISGVSSPATVHATMDEIAIEELDAGGR